MLAAAEEPTVICVTHNSYIDVLVYFPVELLQQIFLVSVTMQQTSIVAVTLQPSFLGCNFTCLIYFFLTLECCLTTVHWIILKYIVSKICVPGHSIILTFMFKSICNVDYYSDLPLFSGQLKPMYHFQKLKVTLRNIT
jgi:hypothetical protein